MGDKNSGLQSTIGVGAIGRADFNKDDFSALINEKGRRVIHEKALQCPCKSAIGNQLSSCQNCGGLGWVYINPISTSMVLSAMRISTDFKPWSEEARGTVNISCKSENELGFMDRLTILDARSYFIEVLHLSKKNGVWFSSFTYQPYNVWYAGLFVDSTSPFTQLVQDTDYLVDGRYLRIIDNNLIPPDAGDREVSITVRYLHSPVYYVLEMGRETMQTFQLTEGKEVLANLPVSGIARKAHYVLKDKISLNGQTLLVNDSPPDSCSGEIYTKNINYSSLTIFVVTSPDPSKTVIVENGVVVGIQYPVGDTITIPHLIGKRVLRPFYKNNIPNQLLPYIPSTGTLDNTLGGGFQDGDYITINYTYNV